MTVGGSGRFSSRRGGTTGSRGTRTQPAAALPPEALDVVTLEPIDEDWQFDVWVSAILEDYPEADDEGDRD